MEKVAFSTGIQPSCTTAADRGDSVAEFDDKRNEDPDKLLQCPFDKNHQIRACRFPYHLLKCRKNHPKLAAELITCPNNARHLIPADEFSHHRETCEDRQSLRKESEAMNSGDHKWQVPESTWVNPNTTEDWEEEADQWVTPFVWGMGTVLLPRLEMKPTNILANGLRLPSTMPWSHP